MHPGWNTTEDDGGLFSRNYQVASSPTETARVSQLVAERPTLVQGKQGFN